jgi:hypothetical protein
LNDTNFQSIYLNTSLSKNESDQDFERSYYDRVLLFEKNCALFQNIHSFLFESINDLFLMSNETVTIFENITQYKDVINNNTLNSKTANNMTADSLGISREYALKDYNITSEDLDAAIADVKDSLSDNPLLNELENITEFANDLLDREIDEAKSVPIIHYWLVAVETLPPTTLTKMNVRILKTVFYTHFHVCTIYLLMIHWAMWN